jgi:hypothetical protein
MKWSEKLSTESDVAPTAFPDGAIINVKFDCVKCGNKGLIAEYVDIISQTRDSGKESKSPFVDVICAKCQKPKKSSILN